VVVDPQVGFCDPSGTLARVYGDLELLPVQAAVRRLAAFLVSVPDSAAVLLTTSEYPLALHTDGVASDPLAGLCVPGAGADCDLVPDIRPRENWVRVVKRQVDAWAEPEFRAAVERMTDDGRSHVVVTGFMATTCVREAVASMAAALSGRGIEVAVAADLVGARASAHRPESGAESRVERAYRAMAAAGAHVLRSSGGLEWVIEPGGKTDR
jgi:nicotinamidase-related amidase